VGGIVGATVGRNRRLVCSQEWTVLEFMTARTPSADRVGATVGRTRRSVCSQEWAVLEFMTARTPSADRDNKHGKKQTWITAPLHLTETPPKQLRSVKNEENLLLQFDGAQCGSSPTFRRIITAKSNK
jgi:hypothetical protein